MFAGSSILVTGGTGSFGKKFVRKTLDKYSPRKIVVFSRDEMKQWDFANQLGNDARVRFFIGDIRDRDRVYRALDGARLWDSRSGNKKCSYR